MRLYPSLLAAAITISALAQQAGVPTIRTGTKLVVVDVTVTDAKHHPVRDLKASDFTLLENNAAQQVKSFEEHRPPSAEELQKIPAALPVVPGEFTNFNPAPAAVANGPVNVLLIDRLNTPMEAQARLRQQLLDYLAKAKPGSRTAIFGLNTQLVLLQGFTTNPQILRAVLDKKGNAKVSALMDPAAATGGAGEKMSDQIDMMTDGAGDGFMNTSLRALISTTKLFESMEEANQTMDRSRRTLDAMNALGRFLVNIPGRKNLVWFSGSFPVDIVPDPKVAAQVQDAGIGGDFVNVSDNVAEYRETLSLLSRAQVVMYPVDARGATVLPNVTVAGEGGLGDKYLPKARSATAPSGAVLLANDIDTGMEKNFTENTTMRDLAFETGGRAFLNNNDLAGAMEDALSDGSSYYTLAYTPGNGSWKGDFRKIEVRLRQKGYVLNYRRGYYADDPLAPPSKWDKLGSGRAVTTSLAAPDFGAMHLALMHAGPELTDLVLKAKVAPTSNLEQIALAQNNVGHKDLKGPYRNYSIDLSTDAHTLDFTSAADGLHHASVEFVTFVYDEYGNVVNGTQNTVQADLKPAVYDQVMVQGLPLHQEVSVPAKGEYYLRIAAHDLNSGRAGAVEIPVDAVRKLAPAAAPVMVAEAKPSVPVPTVASPAASNGVAAAVASAAAASRPVAGPVTAADASLDGILAQVHENFETYLHSVPSLFANERVLSSMNRHEDNENHSKNATTESVFRLERVQEENRPSRLRESRDVHAIDKQVVPQGQSIHGPVVLQGAFGYGASFLSPALKQCYDYRVRGNQKLRGAQVIVVEYISKPAPPKDFLCPVAEQNSGRAFLDPKTMQVVRIEQKRPKHELEAGTYNGLGMGSVSAGGVSASQGATGLYTWAAQASGANNNSEAVTIPRGTYGVWNWAIDYEPVTLDNKVFWLPKTINSSTSTTSGSLIQWNFNAGYANYHLMAVRSTILGVSDPVQ